MLPDLGEAVVQRVAHGLFREDVLLAGGDDAVAVECHAALQSGAGAAPRRGHIRGGMVGDLSGVIGRAGDNGGAQDAQPMVIPGLHLLKILAALGEGWDDQR